jgi:hypothetical protein
MGVLTPLFLLGLAGLSAPVILHLVRRTPRGQQEFSSLMFLAPTPPRLTRRSRLDQVLLLMLRLGALALLAFAFARPFFREASLLSLTDLPRRRVVLLVDTSASMQRGNLWEQALASARKELDDLAPHDEVTLYAFSDRLQTLVGLASLKTSTAAPAVDVVRHALVDLRPTWASGDLGTALVSLASELDAVSDAEQSLAEPHLVVISDFQQGNRIDALQGYPWPEKVRVVPRRLTLKQTTNATLQLLSSDDAEASGEPRVRVVNAADSTSDQFFVHWHNGEKPHASDGELAIYVPPGQSRVVKLPRPANNPMSDRLILRGDDYDFDNTYFVVPPRQQEIRLIYLGSDAETDPLGLQYYLRLATAGDPLRQVSFEALTPAATALQSTPAPQIVVAATSFSAAQQAVLANYVERGGTLLLVPPDRAAAESVAKLLGDVSLAAEPIKRSADDFYLLGEIDFSHPLFAPFANPRYNDFTRIHFWRYHPLQLGAASGARVLARFDSGDPWLVEQSLGKGRIWALTSSWRPDDSQLAVASKFVPLVGTLLDQACGSAGAYAGAIVNAPIPLLREAADLLVKTPTGEMITLADDATTFRGASQPGIYLAGSGDKEFRFAVNLAPGESDTAALPLEQLEQLGLRFDSSVPLAEQLDRLRQARDTELEGRQQVWRWLLVGCLSILILEIWWAGRAARPVAAPAEPLA